MSQYEVQIHIEGMGCRSCVGKIEGKLSTLEGVTGKVDFAEKTAHVTIAGGEISEETVIAAIRSLGYEATLKDRKE